MATVLRSAGRSPSARARVRGSALGRRRTCWTSSTTGGMGRRGTSAGGLHCPARATRSPPRLGRRQAQRADDRPLTPHRWGHRAADRNAAAIGRCCRPRRRPGATRPRGGKSAVCRGVRADADRPGRSAPRRRRVAPDCRGRAARSRVGAGAHRGTAGRPTGRGEVAPAGRRGARQGRLGGSAHGDERIQPVRGRGAAPRPRAAGDAEARAPLLGGRRGGIRVSARAHARRCLQPDPARRAGRETPPRS